MMRSSARNRGINILHKCMEFFKYRENLWIFLEGGNIVVFLLQFNLALFNNFLQIVALDNKLAVIEFRSSLSTFFLNSNLFHRKDFLTL